MAMRPMFWIWLSMMWLWVWCISRQILMSDPAEEAEEEEEGEEVMTMEGTEEATTEGAGDSEYWGESFQLVLMMCSLVEEITVRWGYLRMTSTSRWSRMPAERMNVLMEGKGTLSEVSILATERPALFSRNRSMGDELLRGVVRPPPRGDSSDMARGDLAVLWVAACSAMTSRCSRIMAGWMGMSPMAFCTLRLAAWCSRKASPGRWLLIDTRCSGVL